MQVKVETFPEQRIKGIPRKAEATALSFTVEKCSHPSLSVNDLAIITFHERDGAYV